MNRIIPMRIRFEKRNILALSLSTIVLSFFVSLSYSDGIQVDEARILADTFLSYARLGRVDNCYPLLDPITRETTDKSAVQTLFKNIEQEFGKIISFDYVGSDKGWKFYDAREEQYPLISFKYAAKTEGSDKTYPVRLEVTLMGEKLWISRYLVLFDFETTRFDNIENALQTLANTEATNAALENPEGKQP